MARRAPLQTGIQILDTLEIEEKARAAHGEAGMGHETDLPEMRDALL